MQHYPKVKEVYALDRLKLLVKFENGITKKYDVEQLFDEYPDYVVLRNPDIFNLVRVDCGGYGIAWSDELDLPECELWENGEICQGTIPPLS